MDVQRYIRGINLSKVYPGIYRMVLYSEGQPGIYGFCEFGYDEDAGLDSGYAISFIATAMTFRGKGIGRLLLDSVLRWMANDAAMTGRSPYVATQIDRRNKRSADLFLDLGFDNEGADTEDPDYDVWAKEFLPMETDLLKLYQPIMMD